MTQFRTVLLCALMAGTALADNVPFSRGAIIIPMESTFQSPAGSVSAYGMVYRILQANQAGHRNAGSVVTVYIANDPTKQSVNRCKPTNTATYDATVALPADPKWNDGCDFSIQNLTEQPVVMVTWGAWPAAGATFAAGALNTFVSTESWPKYTPLTAANLTFPLFTKVSYSGAPFIIDASDAQKVWDLFKYGDTGANAFPAIALSPFSASCTLAAANVQSNSTTIVGNIEYSNACHYVDMHQATVSFNAQIERRITVPPPPFALFDPSFGNGTSGSAGVLDKYLQISGLWLRSTAAGATNGNDSQGCAIGNVSGCTVNYSSGAVVGTPATAAQAKAGSIYNRMGLTDLRYTDATYPTGILTQKTGTYPTYRLYWAPHWDSASALDSAAFLSLTAFVQAGGNMLGECASIGSLEGSIGSAASPPKFLYTNGVDYTGAVGSANMHNCSDPGQAAPCADFLSPGNIFSQVADWMFDSQGGTVGAHRPNLAATPPSAIRPYVSRMLVVRNDAVLTDDWDIFDMGQEDTQKGVMIYVGGHDVSAKPLGARVVLNSMLNLGGIPISSERALAGPTIVYASSNAPAYVDQVITPTFAAVSGYSSNSAVKNFDSSNVTNQKLWVWPYYPGHYRSHSTSGLSAGSQSFTSSLIFDSSELETPTGISPLPSLRNLITWVGGYPKDMSATTMTGGAKAPNNQLQIGWVPDAIDGEKFDTTMSCPPVTTNCVDVMGYDVRVTTPTFDGTEGGLHMVVGPDGLCDVQQMLNFSKVNNGADWGNPSCAPANIKKFIDDTPAAAWLLQRVRGYCYTGLNTDFSPADSDCNDFNDNRAHMGGFVHSTSAVMEPSANVKDSGAPRPTVGFAAGYDGQLHAFYIGGGTGYTGPAAVSFNQDNNALAKYKKNWAAQITAGTVPKGTELWSYLPPSQLPWLETNSAQADSSPVIMDVFADFSGTGVREWHSILLLSLGRQSTEIVALDVSNPLLPRMLWDNTGSLFQIGSTPKFSPNILMSDALGRMPGANLAPKYAMVYDASVPSKFKQTLVGYQKAYDYRDLGGTAGLTSSQIRVGLEPQYIVYAVSNMPAGRQGIEVYAIEASTGQMLWQWERQYDGIGPSDNSVPVVATVLSGADGAGVVIVGDHEGRVWELDAATGANLHSTTSGLVGCTVGVPCQFPVFDTQSTAANPQPITTNIAVARIPTGLAAGTALKPYEGERVILFGTAGADWIAAPATVAGRLHVALYETTRQVPVDYVTGNQLDNITAWNAGSTLTASAKGVMQEVPSFPQVFALGERVYGTITIAGSVAYFATAYDKIGDVMAVPATIQGRTYSLNLGTAVAGALTTAFAGTSASYGGVGVYVDKATGAFKGLVTSNPGDMTYTPAASVAAADVADSKLKPALKVNNNQGLAYRLMGWLRRQLK